MRGNRIKDLISYEKPREKLLSLGPSTLTDVELLAIVLRTGGIDKSAIELSREVIEIFDGISNLMQTKAEELIKIPGMGPAKAAEILAVYEISRRLMRPSNQLGTKIKSPEDAFKTVSRELCFDTEEKLILISIDSRNRLISKDIISLGTINETIISAREIYKRALSRNAFSIIIAHNHPSGDTSPSTEDIEVTKVLFQTGKLMGIPLLDHIIINNNSFLSMKRLGIFSSLKEGGDKSA